MEDPSKANSADAKSRAADIPEQKLNDYFALMQNDSIRAYIEMLGLNLPRTKDVKAPVLVLGAENDTALTFEEVEETAKDYWVFFKFAEQEE